MGSLWSEQSAGPDNDEKTAITASDACPLVETPAPSAFPPGSELGRETMRYREIDDIKISLYV
jgi:hypothetical protein